MTRLAGVLLAAATAVGVTTGTAQAAQPREPRVAGTVLLSTSGDHVRLRYSCVEATYVHVFIREGRRAEMTGRYPQPLTCSGRVETQEFFLENLPTATPGLRPGAATATVSLYEGPFGAPYTAHRQRVRVVDTGR